MTAHSQKDKAVQFRHLHDGPPILILLNAWDAASACILEQAGVRAIGTTSSGVAASLGYADGQRISREMMVEVVERIMRANAYQQAGADCLFPIGVSDARTIADLVQAINGPINILVGPTTPSIPGAGSAWGGTRASW